MACGKKLSFPASQGRIINQKIHLDRRWVDIDEIKRLAVFRVGQCFADRNFFKPCKADNIPSRSVFNFNPSQSLMAEKSCNSASFASPIFMDTNDGIADLDSTACDPAESKPAEVIRVIKVRYEHLEIGFRRDRWR